MVVMYAGGNDINAGKSPEQVFADFQAFVAKVRARLPAARIAYISIAPNPARWAQVNQVRAANRFIEDFCLAGENAAFINVFPHMLGEDGQPRPEIFSSDALHLNARGYELWTRVLRPFLAEPAGAAAPAPGGRPPLSATDSPARIIPRARCSSFRATASSSGNTVNWGHELGSS
jgi:lysophospholipase L1-like esterase